MCVGTEIHNLKLVVSTKKISRSRESHGCEKGIKGGSLAEWIQLNVCDRCVHC